MTERDEFVEKANHEKLCAPYNFVPFSETVLKSPVEDLDLSRPVKDAISGVIDVKWTNETPLLVGGSEVETDSQASTPFEWNGHFAIPGSSLRGMIRSIVEIISFGRSNFIEDFAGRIRDTNSPTWKNGFQSSGRQIDGSYVPDEQPAGWLFLTEQGFKFIDGGKTVKLAVEGLVNCLGGTSATEWHQASASGRLDILGNHQMKGCISPPHNLLGLPSRKCQIIVTNNRPDDSNKTHERIMFWPKVPIQSVENVNEHLASMFVSSQHRDSASTSPPQANLNALFQGLCTGFAQNWGLYQKHKGFDKLPTLEAQLEDPSLYGLPVIAAKTNSNERVFSLTPMISVTYAHSVHDILKRMYPEDVKMEALDLAETLFGWAPPDVQQKQLKKRTPRERSLRSRVKFGFAKGPEVSTARLSDIKSIAQMKPRPSFYPFYLKPKPGNNPRAPLDYNNADAILAGRKRYPARRRLSPAPAQGTEGMVSQLQFLKKDQTFASEIRVHNVSPIELGALLWAISLGNLPQNPCRHMLGRAKAYGYGQVRAEITNQTKLYAVLHKAGEQAEKAENSVANPQTGAIDQYACINRFKLWVKDALNVPDIQAFEDLEPIKALLRITDPNIGEALNQQLDWPKDMQATADEQILKGYQKIRKSSYDSIKNLPTYPS